MKENITKKYYSHYMRATRIHYENWWLRWAGNGERRLRSTLRSCVVRTSFQYTYIYIYELVRVQSSRRRHFARIQSQPPSDLPICYFYVRIAQPRDELRCGWWLRKVRGVEAWPKVSYIYIPYIKYEKPWRFSAVCCVLDVVRARHVFTLYIFLYIPHAHHRAHVAKAT